MNEDCRYFLSPFDRRKTSLGLCMLKSLGIFKTLDAQATPRPVNRCHWMWSPSLQVIFKAPRYSYIQPGWRPNDNELIIELSAILVGSASPAVLGNVDVTLGLKNTTKVCRKEAAHLGT